MNEYESTTCKCVYCYTAPKGSLDLPEVPPSLLSWTETPYNITKPPQDSIEKLKEIQEDVLRVLQWQVISTVYKSTHCTITKKSYDVSVVSLIRLSPNIVDHLFPGLSNDLLPINFVHQAFRAMSIGLKAADTISHLFSKIPSNELTEFLSFGICCKNIRNTDFNDFFPSATSDIEIFLKLIHHVVDNICHKPDKILFISNDLKELLREEEKLGILTIYKQDKKDCITGYCSISKAAIFNRLKNQNDRIKPYTNPTMFTIIFGNESILLMTTSEMIMEVLNLNNLHTPIEFVISADISENQTFTKNIVYRGLNTAAFVITAKKEAPCWCKHYVNYITASISVFQKLLQNDLVKA